MRAVWCVWDVPVNAQTRTAERGGVMSRSVRNLHDDQRGAVGVIVLIVALITAISLAFTGCTTRLEEARARRAEAQIEVERAKTDQLRVEREIVEEERRIEEAKVELKEVEGQNYIRKAVAQDITRQSRMYALLQVTWAPLAIIAVISAGLFTLWFFVADNGPYQTRCLWRSTGR